MISRHRLACPAASSFATVRPSGPSGAVPDTATIDPTRTAREIPTRGSYGLPLEINRRICTFDGWPLSAFAPQGATVQFAEARRPLTRSVRPTAVGLWACFRPHFQYTPHRRPWGLHTAPRPRARRGH